jgi:hypothetical protein
MGHCQQFESLCWRTLHRVWLYATNWSLLSCAGDKWPGHTSVGRMQMTRAYFHGQDANDPGILTFMSRMQMTWAYFHVQDANDLVILQCAGCKWPGRTSTCRMQMTRAYFHVQDANDPGILPCAGCKWPGHTSMCRMQMTRAYFHVREANDPSILSCAVGKWQEHTFMCRRQMTGAYFYGQEALPWVELHVKSPLPRIWLRTALNYLQNSKSRWIWWKNVVPWAEHFCEQLFYYGKYCQKKPFWETVL